MYMLTLHYIQLFKNVIDFTNTINYHKKKNNTHTSIDCLIIIWLLHHDYHITERLRMMHVIKFFFVFPLI